MPMTHGSMAHAHTGTVSNDGQVKAPPVRLFRESCRRRHGGQPYDGYRRKQALLPPHWSGVIWSTSTDVGSPTLTPPNRPFSASDCFIESRLPFISGKGGGSDEGPELSLERLCQSGLIDVFPISSFKPNHPDPTSARPSRWMFPTQGPCITSQQRRPLRRRIGTPTVSIKLNPVWSHVAKAGSTAASHPLLHCQAKKMPKRLILPADLDLWG